MKKRFINLTGLLMSLVAGSVMIGFSSCKGDDPEPPTLASITVLQNATEEVADGSRLTTSINGVTLNLAVKSNRAWTITPTSSDWLTISPTQGAKDATTPVTVVVSANTGTERSVTFTAATADNQAKKTFIVYQPGTDSPGVDAIYYEDLGDFREGPDIKTDGTSISGWPSVTEFKTWRRGGDADQSGVVYSGSGSIRNSGKLYDENVIDVSKAPYVHMNSTMNFIIEKINLDGKTNFTFKAAMQHTEKTEAASPYTPTFAAITPTTVKVQAGFDGTSWADLSYTVSADGNSWYWATSEFKVPAGTTDLYVKFSDFIGASGQSLRLDDFTLTEGGNGDLIEIGDTKMGKGLISISDLVDEWSDGTVIPANTKIIGTVVSIGGTTVGNISAPNASIAIVDGTGENSGIFIYGIRQTADNTKFLESHSYAAGTNLEIELGSSKMGSYSGSIQITDLPEANVKAAPAGTTTYADPIVISSSTELSKYHSMLVKIECEPAAASVGKTWASASAYKSLDFVDGNDATFVIFTNKTAAFVDETVPAASGTITGIVGLNSGKYQIMPRVIGDIQLTNAAEIPTLSVAPTSLSFDAAGGTETITVTATVPAGYTLKVDRGDDTFYTATLDGTTITVVTTANTGAALSGSLKVYMTDSSNAEVTEITKTVIISQLAAGSTAPTSAILDNATITAFPARAYADSGIYTATAADNSQWNLTAFYATINGKFFQIKDSTPIGSVTSPELNSAITKVTINARISGGATPDGQIIIQDTSGSKITSLDAIEANADDGNEKDYVIELPTTNTAKQIVVKMGKRTLYVYSIKVE